MLILLQAIVQSPFFVYFLLNLILMIVVFSFIEFKFYKINKSFKKKYNKLDDRLCDLTQQLKNK